MEPFVLLLSRVLSLYLWLLFAYIILDWLVYFGIVNPYQPFVSKVRQALAAIIEPVLMPIRRVLPNFGGVDLSPIVLIFLVYFVQDALFYWLL